MIKKITKKDMTAKPSIKENEKTVSVETAKTTSGSKKSFKQCMTDKKVRGVIGTVFFLCAVYIWYQVGVVLFGLTHDGKSAGSVQPNLPNTTVVAEVSGQPVTLADVRALVDEIPQLSELPFEEIYPQMLETMINKKVIVDAATASGIENDPAVQKILADFKEQLITEHFLAKQLQAMMTPEQLQALYVQELRNFKREEEVLARHIMVATKKQAEDILVQLKNGADFVSLVQKKSLDKKTKDGSLGYFTKSMVYPEFGEAVFALKKGQFSKPIKTQHGWHIVLVEDKRMAVPPSFDEVSEQLKQIYAERHVQDILNNERKKANVKVFKDTLK